MEAYAQALNYAIPIFVGLILVEELAARWMGLRVNRGADVISSLSSGVSNTVKDVLGLSIAIISYDWLVGHIALFEIKAVWLTYVVAFIVKDFAGYWMHRLEHEINFLWNRHIIHHSSEEFNLSCALRQTVSTVFSFIVIFMLPAALLGVPTKVIAIVAPIQLFLQFWYHTRLIGKMGWLEHVLVTPSHHRVHHAMNPEYLDKNYSQIFIVWDKLFGTFQPEMEEVRPVYGVKRPVKTWNPLLINFQHFWLLLTDAWRTRNWWDKVRLWFMPTGWRPADMAEKYPVSIVEDMAGFQKWDSRPSRALLAWSWVQLVVTLAMMFHLTNQIADLSLAQMLIYGAFLMVSIFSYTTLMDRSRWAAWAEVVRAVFATGIIALSSDWFGLQTGLLTALILYFLLSLTAAFWFWKKECASAGWSLKEQLVNPLKK